MRAFKCVPIFLITIFLYEVNSKNLKAIVPIRVDASNSYKVPYTSIKKASSVNSLEIDPNVSPENILNSTLDSETSAIGNTELIENEQETEPVNVNDVNQINQYCKCSASSCLCCRKLGLSLLQLGGPGCAKIRYLGNQEISIDIKYSDITLATRKISGKKPKPVCLSLPGGYSSFCALVYGISQGKEAFNACLGLSLEAGTDTEASIRVSCFEFGSDGVRVTKAKPLPPLKNENEEDEGDFFDLVGDDSADDDDTPDDDYGGFSVLEDLF